MGKAVTAEPDRRWCCMMTDYNAQLIDLLTEKIRRLEQEKDKQRKEINRLKRQIREMEKAANAETD